MLVKKILFKRRDNDLLLRIEKEKLVSKQVENSSLKVLPYQNA